MVALGVGIHVWANLSFDTANAALEDAVTTAAEARESLREDADQSSRTVSAAEAIAASAPDDLVDVTARETFVAAATRSSTVIDAAETVLSKDVDDVEDKPLWTWELIGLVPQLEASAGSAHAFSASAGASRLTLAATEALLTSAGVSLYASVAPAAAALEAANVSARTATVLDFRDAAAAVAGETEVDSAASVSFSAYATRATIMKDSAAAELAEKAGPLLATRLEIEAYARSISGGIVLDFDWAPIVAGIGGSEGIGGTATWNTARGGFSTITLSHSVAENWPSADARALVTHEVGHSITSKCHEKFDWENADANEEWATAWAISMGHTAEGNGVQAYGYPSQGMIDIAATCR